LGDGAWEGVSPPHGEKICPLPRKFLNFWCENDEFLALFLVTE